jgi:hypothetical protein
MRPRPCPADPQIDHSASRGSSITRQRRDLDARRARRDAVSSGRFHPAGDGAPPVPPTRVVIDPDTQRQWHVREAARPQPAAADAGTCLIFDGRDIVRRVWPVPADWRRLSDAELLALAERRPGEAQRAD